MVRRSTKKHQGSRENLQAKSKKEYHTIKKTEKETESTILKHGKCIWEDSNNRKKKLKKEHITDKMKKNRSRRVIKVTQQIKSNVDNGRKIWEIKRKVQRKKIEPSYY